jgi:hypothetical protein
MIKYLSCVLCKNTEAKEKSEYKLGIWKKNDIFVGSKIQICNNCGLGLALPQPNKVKLQNFYTNDYRCQGSPFYFDFKTRLKPFSRNPRSTAQLLLGLNFVNLVKGDVFVDVGPGHGTSFRELIGLFGENQIDCYAIELSKDADNYYKKLYNVKTYSDFRNLIKKIKKKPKLILSSHCLEHFSFKDATKFLKMLQKSMSKDGCCIFEVPHVDLRIHKDLRGDDDPHLLFFSKKSLEKMFLNCNFKVLFIETCGTLYRKKKQSLTNLYKLNFPTNMHKKLFKAVANLMPKLANFFLDKISKINIKDENFRYGGDRECLRIVATPCK